jgi:hypothetical protein
LTALLIRQPGQREAVVARHRDRRACVTEVVQRLVEQDAGEVAGEGAAGRVRAVHARREADDQERRADRPERRHRQAPVAGMLALDVVEERREARTAPARVVVIGRRLGQNGGFVHGAHRRILRPDREPPLLPSETHLETFSRLPASRTRKPPLLFVHGAYVDGWCWTPYFLPWFAKQGWPAHALSLRGTARAAEAGCCSRAGSTTTRPTSSASPRR